MKKFVSIFCALVFCLSASFSQNHRYLPTTRVTELALGKRYMLFDVHAGNSSSVDSRSGFIGGNGSSIVKTYTTTPASFGNNGGSYVWELVAADNENQYYLKNIASGYYYYINGNNSSSLSESNKSAVTFTAYSSSDAQGTTQAIAADGTTVSAAGDNTLWSIKNIGCSGKGTYWNGNKETFATWEDSHAYALYEVEVVADIEAKGYRIFTQNNGNTNGSTRYYMKADGTLTVTDSEAEIFVFSKTTQDKWMPTGYAYKISGQSTNKRFTNPNGEERTNNIRTTTNSRDDYDSQVFYINEEGLFAVRASNVNDATWHTNAFWTVEDNGNELPDADYDQTLDQKHYVWQLEPMVTYQLKYNDQVLATTYLPPMTGTPSLPTTAWERPFCSFTYNPATTDETTETVDVNLVWNGPFSISQSYDNAIWYLLHMRQNGYNVKYETGATKYPLSSSTNFTDDDAYYWAFLGNPYEGVQLINKAAGGTQTLYAGASPNNSGTYPLMSSENTTKWIINGNPKNGEVNAFGLQVPGKDLYLNDYRADKFLSFWSDNASEDAGSTLTVQPVTEVLAALVNQNISPYFNNLGNYFSLKSSTEAISMGNICATSATNCEINTYRELVDFVNNRSNIRYPETGNYRIKNVSSNKYIGYGTAGYTGKGVGLIEVEANNLSSIVHLTKVSDGVYAISIQGLNVQTQSTRNLPVQANSDAASNYTFDILSAGIVSVRADESDSKGYLFRSSWGATPESIITWEVNGDVAKWVVESAENVTISLTAANDNTDAPHTYATLCVPFEITALEGVDSKYVKAYTPTIDGSYVVPGAGATTIAAATPVILIGEEGATSVTAAIGSNYAAAPSMTNALSGTFTGMSLDCSAATGSNYVLGFDADNNNRIGFYHVNNTAFALGANRAYLAKAGSSVKGFAINFDLTDGINDLEGTKSAIEQCFDLSGRRVNQPTRGLYITNGKKVVIK